MEQDSLLFRNKDNGHLYLWDNQGQSLGTWNWQQHDIGKLESGWGGLGCWSAGECSGWTDLNASIETTQESSFVIVA